MSRPLLATLVLVSVSTLSAADPKPSVSLEAEFRKEDRTSRPPIGAILIVRLVAGDEKIGVITENLRVTVSRDGRKATVRLAMTEKEEHNDRLVVPSADKLGVVRLQPGEVARVPVPFRLEMNEVLKGAAVGDVEIIVEYEVSEFWGKRFGVAHGKYRSTATALKSRG